MNGGFFIGFYIYDAVRAGLGEHGRFVVPGLGVELSTYRTILLASLALAVPSYVIAYLWVREGVEVTDQGVVITPEQRKYPGLNMVQALGSTIRDTLHETGRIFLGLWQQPGFYKFLAFLSFAAKTAASASLRAATPRKACSFFCSADRRVSETSSTSSRRFTRRASGSAPRPTPTTRPGK